MGGLEVARWQSHNVTAAGQSRAGPMVLKSHLPWCGLVDGSAGHVELWRKGKLKLDWERW